jgi:Tol biopolymer transport system component
MRQESRDPGIARFAVRTGAAPLLLSNSALAISPDGKSFVYRGQVGDRSRLYLRSIDNVSPVPIPGTDDGYGATFSPDGRWLAFLSSRVLYKIPREGGTPIRLSDSFGGGLGLDWYGDTIFVTRGFAGGIWAIPADGGKGRLLVKTDQAKQLRAITWPNVLPGGETFLATVWNVGSWDEATIMAFSVKDGTSKVVLQNGSFGRYSPTGHLLFIRGGHLMAIPFDPKTLAVGSNAVIVVRGVSHGSADGEAQYAISRNGHLIYVAGGDSKPTSTLLWTDTAGRQTPIVATKRPYGSLSFSPDGRNAVVTLEAATYDVWNLDLERDSLSRISYGGDDVQGVITPDGTRVLWCSSRAGPYNVYSRPLDGSAPEQRLVPSAHDQENPNMSPDGRHLVYVQYGRRADLWLMPSAAKPRELIATEFDEYDPAISPDGRWLAYSSNESGESQVYLTSFPQPAGKWQVSTDGGGAPRWMPNGREIVYQNGSKVLIIPIEMTPRPRPGRPRLLVEGHYDDQFDISADGRIGLVLSEGAKTATELQLVMNWFEDLKRRVPNSH